MDLRENEVLELKKAKDKLPKSFWETYSAFANTDGGLIILGFDENNPEEIGLNDPDKMRDDLFDQLNNPQKVSANVLSNENIQIKEVEGGSKIIFVQVPEASYRQKPIYLNGNPANAYERLGEGDRKLTPEKYKALVVGSQEETDGELLKNYDISDLNQTDLDIYRDNLYRQTNNEKYIHMDYEVMLKEIGAYKKDRQGDGNYYMTTGCLLFFGKFNAITDRFPGFQLDYFEKETSLTTGWNDRISSGDAAYPDLNVYGFLRLAMEKLDSSLKDEFILDEETKTRLPFKSDLLTSVREALVNALMHAYYDSDTPIKVTAYSDYFEFFNPGKMRISVDEFINGGTSNIRNHTISTIMRRIGISEKAGSGGPRIFDIASKYNLKLPEVLRKQDHTIVRIWKVDLEETFKDYSENQQQILYYLIENHTISRSEALNNLRMDPYSFRTSIQELMDMNIIEMVGKGRSTKYMLRRSSPEQFYSMKRVLRYIEDNMVGRG